MVSDIFAVSASWSRSVIEFADGLDPWMQTAAEWGTDLFLGVFAFLFLMAWWRARSVSSRLVGLALFAPVATVIAYAVSRTIKSLFEQMRPCQAMTDCCVLAKPVNSSSDRKIRPNSICRRVLVTIQSPE